MSHEARPGDLDALRYVGEVARGDDGLRGLPRGAFQRLRHAHREIGLKIRALGTPHHRIDGRVLGAKGLADGLLQARRVPLS